jgi:23S rRNA (uracil1939-C5)-methyltransferase
LPQVEVAVGGASTVLVLRHLEALTADDETLLRTLPTSTAVIWYLQPAGVDSVRLFHPVDAAALSYEIT